VDFRPLHERGQRVGVQLAGLVERGQRLVEPLEPGQHDGAGLLGRPAVRLQLRRARQVGQRLFRLVHVGQGQAAGAHDGGVVGHEPDGLVQVGPLVLRLLAQGGAEDEGLDFRIGVVGAELDGLIEQGEHFFGVFAARQKVQLGGKEKRLRLLGVVLERFFDVGQGGLAPLAELLDGRRAGEQQFGVRLGAFEQRRAQEPLGKLGARFVQPLGHRALRQADDFAEVVDRGGREFRLGSLVQVLLSGAAGAGGRGGQRGRAPYNEQ